MEKNKQRTLFDAITTVKKQNNLLLGILAISALSITTAFSSTSFAQSIASIEQIKAAAESSCTFEKEKTVTYTDENGIEQEDVEYYNSLDYGCTESKYGGQLVGGNLRFDRAKETFTYGAVVTLKGDGYTAYCRGADDAVDWFNTNGEPTNLLTVKANFDGLQSGIFSEDVNLENCQFSLN